MDISSSGESPFVVTAHTCEISATYCVSTRSLLLGNSSRCFLLGSHRLSFTAADYHRCRHLHPTSNENAHDEHLRAATTEGNSPLENNSIKGRCANCSESNAAACYSAELDAPCLMSSCLYYLLLKPLRQTIDVQPKKL